MNFSAGRVTRRWQGHFHRELKDAAPVDALRGDFQLSTVRLDQSLGGFQAETYAVGVHLDGPVKFTELLTKQGNFIGSDANARVCDLNDDLAARGFVPCHDLNEAVQGELKGVSYDVDENLSKPQLIADKKLREVYVRNAAETIPVVHVSA